MKSISYFHLYTLVITLKFDSSADFSNPLENQIQRVKMYPGSDHCMSSSSGQIAIGNRESFKLGEHKPGSPL